MILRSLLASALIAVASIFQGVAAPGDVDAGFAPDVVAEGYGYVLTTTAQPDGKVLIGGRFSSVNGVTRNNLARLHADGSLDASFDPNTNLDSSVNCVAVWPDGRILIGGTFSTLQPNGAAAPIARHRIALLNPDGTVDLNFDPNPDSYVSSFAVQPDGKIVVGGGFGSFQPNGAAAPTTRHHIARLNPDGTVDAGFDPNTDGDVYTVAVQADGKVLLGGYFNSLHPAGTIPTVTRWNLARVNANGTLDTAFDPRATDGVECLAVQADGKILVGGLFFSFRPNGGSTIPRRRVARINPDGTIDENFVPGVGGILATLAVQADGKILLGGHFDSIQPAPFAAEIPRENIARVRADGSLDLSFDPHAGDAGGDVSSIAVQADGKVLLGGSFTSLQPNGAPAATTRHRCARLDNDPAIQTLSPPNTTTVRWERQGSGPALTGEVTFEQSIDGGAAYTLLGSATRVGTTETWELTGLALPATGGLLRARGRAMGGTASGSAGLIEQVAAFSNLPTFPSITAPASTNVTARTATLGGNVTADGDTAIIERGVVFAPTATNADPVIGAAGVTTVTTSGTTGSFALNVSGLVPYTGYRFKAYVKNSVGTAYTTVGTFTTSTVAPGDLDVGWGTAGRVTVGSFPGVAMAQQADGKFIVVTSQEIIRLLPDGTLDAGFGVAGSAAAPATQFFFSDVALQADGKILAAASYWHGIDSETAVVRYLPDGTLDTSWGADGWVSVNVGEEVDAPAQMAVQGDGKIVVVGEARHRPDTPGDFFVVRWNSDGSLDTGFGSGGKVVTVFEYATSAKAVALQSDGKIVVVGHAGVPLLGRGAMARYLENGTLDSSFGTGGKVIAGSQPSLLWFTDCAIQSDGAIVVAASGDGILARYRSDGVLDSTFGNGGVVQANAPLSFTTALMLILTTDGRIVVAGTYNQPGGYIEYAVTRFYSDGRPDTSFGEGGGVTTSFTGTAVPSGLLIQGDRKIVVGGSLDGLHAILARYEVDSPSETLPPVLIAPASSTAAASPIEISFALPEAALPGSVELTLDPGGAAYSFVLSSENETAGLHAFSFDLAHPENSSQIVSGGALNCDGVLFKVTISYRDAAGNARATSVPATDVFIDTMPPVLSTISLIGEPHVALVRAGEKLVLSITATKPIQTPQVTIGGVTATVTGGPLNWTASITVAAGAPADGEVSFSIVCRDLAGNVGTFSATTDTSHPKVDTTPPGVGTLDGYTPLVLYAAQGGTVALPDYASQAQSPDNDAVITQDPPVGTQVGEGVVTVTVTATDPAGNTSIDTVDIPVLVGGTAALAMKGEAVPNDQADPRIPTGSTWATFGVPSISMNGTTAGWMATVKASAKVSFQGIFHGAPTAPKLALRTGDGATDVNGAPVSNVTFKSFREPVFSCDEFAVLATVKGTGIKTANDTGIWFGREGELLEIAREGTVAAGTSVKFKAFTSLAMPSPGVVFFVATLAAPAPKDMGLWVWTPEDGLLFVLREGDAPDLGGNPVALKSFKALTSVTGSPGHGRYDGALGVLDVLLTLQDGTSVTAVVAPDASVTAVEMSGQQDNEGHTLATLGVPSSPGPANSVSRVTLEFDAPGGITKANNTGIYDTSENVLRAQTGLPAVGAEPAKFKNFLDPVAGLDPLFAPVQAFAGTLSGTVAAKDTGIWAYTDATSLRLVAREGSEPQDVPGTKWKTFTSLSILEGRGVMFTATLASGTTKVKPTNDVGLWATDSTGALKLILRENQEVLPGKFLRSFDVLKAIAGSPGQRRAWTAGDASARLIYRAFFTDGTSGIVSTAVP